MQTSDIIKLENDLRAEGLILTLYDPYINAWPDVHYSKCVTWHIMDINNNYSKLRFEGRIPKKGLTVEYLLERINIYDKRESVNYVKVFKKALKLDDRSICMYPASYGVGIANIYNPEKNKSIETIKSFLELNNITYKTEFSDAHWVFRFKISQTKENINRLETLCV